MAIGSTIGDMSFNVTSGAINQTLSVQLNNLEHLLIHGKHKGVRFYYSDVGGGGVMSVLTRSLINGAVSELGNLARNEFKDLLWGKEKKPKQQETEWAREKAEAIKSEASDDYGYGKFPVNEGSAHIYATDHQGYRCRDALMLGIPLAADKKIPFSQKYRNDNLVADFKISRETDIYNYVENNIPECDHLVWFDCTAIVNVASSKNLVVTSVQGRDYSRKELVSNGDLNIDVSGYITSLYPDVYPRKEVEKLKKILSYKGIIEVNNIILDCWDVSKIIIKDFNFPQEEGGKAVQKYTFSAVAVQPTRISEVNDDTIKIVTQPFDVKVKEDSKWIDMLEQQLDMLKHAAGSLVDVGLSKGSEWLNNSL